MTNIGGLSPLPGGINPQSLESTEHIKKASTVLQDYIKNLTITQIGGNNQTGKAGDTGKPTLPQPASGVDTDLAQLLLKLQEETGEKQLKAAVEFIKTNKSVMEGKQKERVDKILKAAEKAEKAGKAGKAGEVFAWVALIVTVVVAVAACVATGGLAAGPCIAAVMAVAMMVLQKTGAMDSVMEAATNGCKKLGIKEPWAQVVAAIVITAVIVAISIVAMNAGGAGAALGRAATVMQRAGTISTIAMGLGAGVTGGVSGYYQGQSLYDKADAKEIAKMIAKLAQHMEDEQETIQQLVEQMQSGVNVVMDIMKSESETKNKISRYTSV